MLARYSWPGERERPSLLVAVVEARVAQGGPKLATAGPKMRKGSPSTSIGRQAPLQRRDCAAGEEN
eukprot:1159606-Pelagomonas_calceolata.AAC.2